MDLQNCKRKVKIGLHNICRDDNGEMVMVCHDRTSTAVRVNERALRQFAGMGDNRVLLMNGVEHQWELSPEQISQQPDYVANGPYGAFWAVEPELGEVF